MTQTGVIRHYGEWPNGVSLEFESIEIDHLSKHTKEFIEPGKSPFDGARINIQSTTTTTETTG
jgi:hypothetical protein